MGKTLTQIAFEFSSEAAIKKAYTPPRPPAQQEEEIHSEPVVVPTENTAPEKPADIRKPAIRKSPRGRKSLKDIALEAELTDIPADEELFKKQYYAIGEVAEMFRVNQSLLRYWENEFDILQPRKNRKGDRFFRPVDIKNLQLIHDLLRRRKFTIEGAKDYLKQNKKAEQKFALIESLQRIRAFLHELKANL